jgi:hypothetical protein
VTASDDREEPRTALQAARRLPQCAERAAVRRQIIGVAQITFASACSRRKASAGGKAVVREKQASRAIDELRWFAVGRIDFERAAAFVASVPEGQWTSYKDVATAAGNERGAMAVGEWPRRYEEAIPRSRRVLRSDGYVAEGFSGHSPGSPHDADSLLGVAQHRGVAVETVALGALKPTGEELRCSRLRSNRSPP